jgi:hypothetical protein
VRDDCALDDDLRAISPKSIYHNGASSQIIRAAYFRSPDGGASCMM